MLGSFCLTIIIEQFNLTITYGHRWWKSEGPVRSPVLKPSTGRLVVRWVTTSGYLLLYVFDICHLAGTAEIFAHHTCKFRTTHYLFLYRCTSRGHTLRTGCEPIKACATGNTTPREHHVSTSSVAYLPFPVWTSPTQETKDAKFSIHWSVRLVRPYSNY